MLDLVPSGSIQYPFSGAIVPQSVVGTANLGNKTMQGLLSTFLPGYGTGALTIVGQEIHREFIPEPNTAALLGLGLAGIAAGLGRTTRPFR